MDASGNVSAPTPAFQLQVGAGVRPADRRRRLPDGGYAPVRLGDPLGSGDPGQPGHDRRWKRHPRRRDGQSDGIWQFTPTLSKGKHSIMAEATNSAGYTSLLSSALNVNV